MGFQLPITQHKRFVPLRTQANFCFAKTSFMLKPLYAILLGRIIEDRDERSSKRWIHNQKEEVKRMF